jgi:hypothetical protein
VIKIGEHEEFASRFIRTTSLGLTADDLGRNRGTEAELL